MPLQMAEGNDEDIEADSTPPPMFRILILSSNLLLLSRWSLFKGWERHVSSQLTSSMVLADLGRKLNAALSSLNRAPVIDEKVHFAFLYI